MNYTEFDLHTSKARYQLQVVLLSPLARQCKDEFPGLINIPLADFFVDIKRRYNANCYCRQAATLLLITDPSHKNFGDGVRSRDGLISR